MSERAKGIAWALRRADTGEWFAGWDEDDEPVWVSTHLTANTEIFPTNVRTLCGIPVEDIPLEIGVMPTVPHGEKT